MITIYAVIMKRYIRSAYSFNDGSISKWYVIDTDGAIHPWVGDIDASLARIPVARLGAGYHQNLSLLLNAAVPPQSSLATVTVNGSTLDITPELGFEGVFQVSVSASDATVTGPTRQFYVTVHNNPPVLEAIDDQNASPGENVVVVLSATDADGDAVSFSADVTDLAAGAYQLQQTYGFYQYGGSFDRNKRGANEIYVRAQRPPSKCARSLVCNDAERRALSLERQHSRFNFCGAAW